MQGSIFSSVLARTIYDFGINYQLLNNLGSEVPIVRIYERILETFQVVNDPYSVVITAPKCP